MLLKRFMASKSIRCQARIITLKNKTMECREKCGACCIALSISSPIPGMPQGKAAGVPCIHLGPNLECQIFGQPDRPKTCLNFKPESAFCGHSAKEAMHILSNLEKPKDL